MSSKGENKQCSFQSSFRALENLKDFPQKDSSIIGMFPMQRTPYGSPFVSGISLQSNHEHNGGPTMISPMFEGFNPMQPQDGLLTPFNPYKLSTMIPNMPGFFNQSPNYMGPDGNYPNFFNKVPVKITEMENSDMKNWETNHKYNLYCSNVYGNYGSNNCKKFNDLAYYNLNNNVNFNNNHSNNNSSINNSSNRNNKFINSNNNNNNNNNISIFNSSNSEKHSYDPKDALKLSKSNDTTATDNKTIKTKNLLNTKISSFPNSNTSAKNSNNLFLTLSQDNSNYKNMPTNKSVYEAEKYDKFTLKNLNFKTNENNKINSIENPANYNNNFYINGNNLNVMNKNSFNNMPVQEETKKITENNNTITKKFFTDFNFGYKCSCTKTNCNRLYCECFANGRYCHDCNCKNCLNMPPVNSSSNRRPETKKKISVTCTCTKSGCNKKYCECFKNGTKCTELCRCSGCENNESGRKVNEFLKPELVNSVFIVKNQIVDQEIIDGKIIIRNEEGEIINDKAIVDLSNNFNNINKFDNNNPCTDSNNNNNNNEDKNIIKNIDENCNNNESLSGENIKKEEEFANNKEMINDNKPADNNEIINNNKPTNNNEIINDKETINNNEIINSIKKEEIENNNNNNNETITENINDKINENNNENNNKIIKEEQNKENLFNENNNNLFKDIKIEDKSNNINKENERIENINDPSDLDLNKKSFLNLKRKRGTLENITNDLTNIDSDNKSSEQNFKKLNENKESFDNKFNINITSFKDKIILTN